MLEIAEDDDEMPELRRTTAQEDLSASLNK